MRLLLTGIKKKMPFRILKTVDYRYTLGHASISGLFFKNAYFSTIFGT